jgi:hypothetical protein
MATFIEIRTDAFAKNLNRVKQGGINYTGVRRPFRGIEIKEDTYAIIKVLKANGDPIPLVDAGGPYSPGQTNIYGPKGVDTSGYSTTYNYSNFIIQQITDSRQEKQQILETFGDSYIFFFGERPRVLSVAGMLINTLDFNWRTEFWHNYEHTLRGTKLVEQNARIYLHWDDIIVEGYMLEAMARDDANSPYHIPFSFQLFVTNHTYLSTVGDDDYPVTHAVNLDLKLGDTLRQEDVEAARTDLKAYSIAAKKQARDIETVKLELEASNQPAVSTQPVKVTSDKGLMRGKNVLATALAMGVHAQNLTFLSIVNTMFRSRKMRLPKGIGGMLSYIGAAEYSGRPAPFAEGPKRTLPYRSKIRDNKDEYIGTVDEGDPSFSEWVQEQNTSPTIYDLEQIALHDLEAAGIDVIQHPGGSKFKDAHSLGAFGGAMSSAALLALGFTVSRTLAETGNQGVGGLLDLPDIGELIVP